MREKAHPVGLQFDLLPWLAASLLRGRFQVTPVLGTEFCLRDLCFATVLGLQFHGLDGLADQLGAYGVLATGALPLAEFAARGGGRRSTKSHDHDRHDDRERPPLPVPC